MQNAAGGRKFGGAEGDRTPDLRNAIAALSQLSYGPDRLSAPVQRIRASLTLGEGNEPIPIPAREIIRQCAGAPNGRSWFVLVFIVNVFHDLPNIVVVLAKFGGIFHQLAIFGGQIVVA
jgi:hypothetical protein